MWKNRNVERGGPRITIWRLRIACWLPWATNLHTDCVTETEYPELSITALVLEAPLWWVWSALDWTKYDMEPLFSGLTASSVRLFSCLTLSVLYIYMEFLVKPELLTSYIYGPTFGNAESRLFLFAAQCSTLNQCKKLSCGTVVCKHFASYQRCPNYRSDFIR
jgi:hypothetical protein